MNVNNLKQKLIKKAGNNSKQLKIVLNIFKNRKIKTPNRISNILKIPVKDYPDLEMTSSNVKDAFKRYSYILNNGFPKNNTIGDTLFNIKSLLDAEILSKSPLLASPNMKSYLQNLTNSIWQNSQKEVFRKSKENEFLKALNNKYFK